MAWLTPNNPNPGGKKCRPLFIPDDLEYIMAVSGALLELTKPQNWQQFGAATPEETAKHFQTMLYEYLNTGCNPVAEFGDMKFSARTEDHNGWLICNGRNLNRTAYEELFDAIGVAYGVGDGVATFGIPDMRARFPLGAHENVLPDRPDYFPGDVGGTYSTDILVSNLPPHQHGQRLLNNAIARVFTTSTAGGQAPAATNTPAANAQILTDLTGGGNPINNMPAYQVAVWFIFAGN